MGFIRSDDAVRRIPDVDHVTFSAVRISGGEHTSLITW